ncbi:MAG: hypothetical protein ACOXZV_08410 [Bacteroidales bacterium]|jgi:hypothetical protein
MNTDSDLLYRLLRLYPVSVVKSNFDTDNRVQIPMLHEIVSKIPREAINEFAVNNLGFTKQHVFIFNNPVRFHDAASHNFKPESHYVSFNNEGIKSDVYFIEQDYNLIVSEKENGNIARMVLRFRQPMVIELNINHIILKFTILERSPSSYLDDYEVLKFTRVFEDEQIVEQFVQHFRSIYSADLHRLDINRGVKHLWNNNFIDAISIKYKRTASMATEVMDEDFTFKSQYPEKFNEVMLSPLRKHAFRFLINQDDYCDFVVDPTEGMLSFNKYPTSINQIYNVITEILRYN